jgi:hypothetical protein
MFSNYNLDDFFQQFEKNRINLLNFHLHEFLKIFEFKKSKKFNIKKNDEDSFHSILKSWDYF